MREVEEFDLLNSPLQGTNLIEASAGTGKTYTIAGLFLRLLLEKGLAVDEILVVTFTEAATGELRQRIRAKLRQAEEALVGGEGVNPFLEQLLQRQKSPAAAARALQEALHGFDQAAIYTIHGFCLKVLQERAFETGDLFDIELLTDQENFKREVVEDFWRQHFYRASPLFINYVIARKFSPDNLVGLLGNRVTQPALEIIPEMEPPDSSGQEARYQECFERLRQTWPQARAEVEEILTHHNGLHKGRYKRGRIAVLIRAMDQFVSSAGRDIGLFAGLEKLGREQLEAATRQGCKPPDHPFFALCQELSEARRQLLEAFEQRLLGLQSRLFDYARKELERRKQQKNVHSFDDLLLKLERALSARGGAALARAIRRMFRAALIDEFQDTDPVQYTIFRKIFGEDGAILFLIGDPKQAIYGFRGADIFAYLEAAARVGRRYTLEENWRSEPGLIRAINTLFASVSLPFVYRDIAFQPAGPAAAQDGEILRLPGQPQEPLQLWFLDPAAAAESDRPLARTRAYELICRAVAAEISRLLELGRKNLALLGERPLRESDIAVLVRRNKEARLMQAALAELNIPSVLYSTESLFASAEAVEVARVLAAVAEPENGRRLKAALATEMIGMHGEQLEALLEDEAEWERWLVRFRRYHDLWKQRGFIVMFRRLLAELAVVPRLMRLPGGERRNTNVLHLGEVLHRAAVERRLGPSGLRKWLAHQRAAGPRQVEEYQLRLESDANAVRLVTVHKSKGLEYAVVFCPFTWDGSRLRDSRRPLLFHQKQGRRRLTLDLGSAEREQHLALAEEELLAENLRLLYVALTRARNRCYLVWGRFNRAETSAPAYLLHSGEVRARGAAVEASRARFEALSERQVRRDLARVEQRAGGAIRVSEMPLASGKRQPRSLGESIELGCREFSGSIERQWQISSFSALVSGRPQQAEQGDRDALSLAGPEVLDAAEEAAPAEEALDIFSFPRGLKAGTCLHDIFEHLDFVQKDRAATERLVAEKLRAYGFDPSWQPTIVAMIQKVLAVPLEKGRDDFSLSAIGGNERLNELGFYFPLQSISPGRLKRLFAGPGAPAAPPELPESIEGLEFAPVKGFMKGFIDMVFRFEGRFYLLDWKSNVLGRSLEDYGQEALAAVMARSFYLLQYHLYTVALNQYLRHRCPGYDYDRHFGGVFYVFLRGVEPELGPDYGIYRDRPPREMIEALSGALLAGNGSERS